MKNLYTEIKEEGYEPSTVGEDIVNTFFNGNFSDGVEELKEINICARDFLKYIEEQSKDIGYENIHEFMNNFFDYEFFISLANSYK